MKNSQNITEQRPTTSSRNTMTGVVTSDKMKDTIVVRVSRFVKHPKYGKYISIDKKFKAHDAGNTKKIGDKVTIEECAPISKEKHFRLKIEN
ncbi:MAG TPA: 30S ribosomal protein S17 [Candidatus Paceibacterota bacterium]